MAQFDDREKSFEQKYKLDKELEFKINARRNKLLGLWVAGEMGLAGEAADAYAKAVVMSDFDRPGDDDVVQKILDDCTAKAVAMNEHRLRKHMAELLAVARDQLMKDMK